MAGFTHFGKIGILRKQAVARMNRVHVSNFGGADYGGNVEITLGQLRRSNADGFIGKTHMQRISVGIAVDRHRADAELLAGANDPQSDFTTIGNQDLFEH